MATLVRELREGGHKNNVLRRGRRFSSARARFLSAMFHDEPTIEADVDDGAFRLLRRRQIMNSTRAKGGTAQGCRTGGLPSPSTNASGPRPFAGATFHYLAGASTIVKDSGKSAVPALRDQDLWTASRVAFIGFDAQRARRLIISPASAAGLEISATRAATVNCAGWPELKSNGPSKPSSC